jgi:tetratricopeptide (TPR) repeat protein
MKYKVFYKSLFICWVMVAAFAISCHRDLDKTDPSRPTLEGYFKNSDELLRGTNAIYSVVRSASLVAREWYFLHDLRSDEVKAGGGQLELVRRQIWEGNITPANAVMQDNWFGWYTTIHRANTVIKNAANVEDNPALRDRCVAEAKFFRGWAYFELVSLWGPVPLYTEPVTSPTDFQPRAAEDVIYDQIERDLNEAAEGLPVSYSGGEDLGRATKGAAYAMLGRALMQRGDYQGARTALLKVVDLNVYKLVDNYMDNFLEETEFNEESILEIAFFDRGDNSFNWGYTGDGSGESPATVRNQEYCPVAWRNLIPSEKYMANFEHEDKDDDKTDPRIGMSVYFEGDTYNNGNSILTAAEQNGEKVLFNGDSLKISWRKFMLIYKMSNDEAQFHPGGNNQRIIRYAEVLLNLAECENELENPTEAVKYLNAVRDRASVAMPHYPTDNWPVSNKLEIQRAIMHEKWAELGGEQIRNRDILRWRKKGYFAVEPIPYYNPGRDGLLPIPQQEIDNNPELGSGGIPPQNPNY